MGKCSKCELRTSRGHILRTSPLIFAYLEQKNRPYTSNISIDFCKSACIHTNTFVNTTLRTLSPLAAAEKNAFSSGTTSQAIFAAMGKVSGDCP